MTDFETIVIGGGQAGLAMAKQLKDKGMDYILLERHSVGDVWRNRPKDMQLFTSRQFCRLSNIPLSGCSTGYPTAQEFGDYLQQFGRQLNLNIREQAEVTSLIRIKDQFEIKLSSGERVTAATIVNATGANQIPYIPEIAKKLDCKIKQYDSTLSNPQAIPDNTHVLIAGDSATGRQLAKSLAERCQVILAKGSKRSLTPNKILGRDIFWWLNKLGVLYCDKNSFIGKQLTRKQPIPCKHLKDRHLSKCGVKITTRIVACNVDSVSTESGETFYPRVIIWATGFKDNIQWMKLPHCYDEKGFLHHYGETPEPGLFITGKKWMTGRASELVMGADRDATMVIQKIQEYLKFQERFSPHSESDPEDIGTASINI